MIDLPFFLIGPFAGRFAPNYVVYDYGSDKNVKQASRIGTFAVARNRCKENGTLQSI